MKKQRKTRNLGLNRSRDKEKIYNYLEKTLGIRKKYCSRGTSKKKSQYRVIHKGKNPLPIRNFNLLGAYVDKRGKVIISKKPGLQSYCIDCERKYRRGRLNKWYAKYSKLTNEEIYQNYRTNYGKLCPCSMCGKKKNPEDFPISRRMDRGLHNTCKDCSKTYRESVGHRWIIYSPDGRNSVRVREGDSCKFCGLSKNLHKDHIWPISKGGTDRKENIQILCNTCNQSKLDSIMGLNSLYSVKEEMICNRYMNLLKEAKKNNWSLKKFELEISKAVRDLIMLKKNMNDRELKEFFQKEKRVNNRKHSVDRAVKKFKEYCNIAITDINEYVSKNQ